MPASGRLVLCLDPAVGLTANSVHDLIHEYFHATQYGYPEVFADYADGSQELWIIEGMAASAMESYFVDGMLRNDQYGGLHYADVTLKSTTELEEYQAQDFWVYYGQRNGPGLPYPESVLEVGATSQAVADVLGDGEVLEVYWDWAKNHVMEPEVDYDGELATPCELETQVVILPEEVSVGGYSNSFHDVPLDPLSSIVVDIRWDWDGYTFATGRVFPPSGQDPSAEEALRYRFHEEGESGCEAVPDGQRTYVDPDPAKRYYLVISNIDHDDLYTFRVLFEYAPFPP